MVQLSCELHCCTGAANSATLRLVAVVVVVAVVAVALEISITAGGAKLRTALVQLNCELQWQQLNCELQWCS